MIFTANSNFENSYVPSGGLDYGTTSAVFPHGTPDPSFNPSFGAVTDFGNRVGKALENFVTSPASAISAIKQPSGSSSSVSDYGYSSDDPYMSYSASTPNSASLQELYPWTMVSPAYGADPKTAMQEALANTAVERQMQDFKRAGLNPVLAAKYGGADSNIDVGSVGLYGGSSAGYVPSGTGDSGAYVSSGSGKKSSALSNLSMQQTTKQSIAALTSGAITGLTGNFQLGAAAYFGAQSLLNAFVPTKRY